MKKLLYFILILFISVVIINSKTNWVFGDSNDETHEYMCCASDYKIERPPVESKHIKGLMIEAPKYFRCPSDTSIILKFEPKHGEPFSCDGHTFIVWGNVIEIVN